MSFWDSVMGRGTGIPAGAPAPDRDRELVLYKYDSCPYCQRVLRALDQLQIEVELRDILREPEAREALRKATGRTTVPCLFIDGQPLFESADIVAWLRAYADRGAADGG